MNQELKEKMAATSLKLLLLPGEAEDTKFFLEAAGLLTLAIQEIERLERAGEDRAYAQLPMGNPNAPLGGD